MTKTASDGPAPPSAAKAAVAEMGSRAAAAAVQAARRLKLRLEGRVTVTMIPGCRRLERRKEAARTTGGTGSSSWPSSLKMQLQTIRNKDSVGFVGNWIGALMLMS